MRQLDSFADSGRCQAFFSEQRMTKDDFKSNLNDAVDSVIKLTSQLCHNSFSSNYRYVVRPNSEGVDPHLDLDEIFFHSQLLALSDKCISNQEVVDLLWTNGRAPLWINMSVLESRRAWTTIELLTSRRLRAGDDMNKVVDISHPGSVTARAY